MRPAERRLALGLYRAGPRRHLLAAALDLGVTALDTAANYQHHQAHRVLADQAGPLLRRFDLTTKIGYFPGGHDLDPARLRAAADQAARDLGRPPDTLLLHNPEHDPAGFARAAEELVRLRERGRVRRWGISTWNPAPLLAHLDEAPRPDVLMTRAGLAVPAHVLDAGDRLAEQLSPGSRWGMAPFGGNPADPLWHKLDTRPFLAGRRTAPALQAALAIAYGTPAVARIAAGTSDPAHLAELATATRDIETDPDTLARYRTLLREAATVREHREAGGDNARAAEPG
ncbi:aldo/keto reductase [Kitasatospora sp. NPDC059327]|uniref:aldo/keto reductase n=1 Tax=Kitasatospora sp. NPDC059327 TaxID=3346803 RepID=UPI0036A4B5D2